MHMSAYDMMFLVFVHDQHAQEVLRKDGGKILVTVISCNKTTLHASAVIFQIKQIIGHKTQNDDHVNVLDPRTIKYNNNNNNNNKKD